ncbi:hypothetical protein LASUN_13280 [Lentilactobacillus sunkii]|uniref:Uncharacterized protein n=1 Tax=Lentilactobacillus sunkii TaxID=481719 RepID=A0A1E7XCN8_9LACO|nr:hypothetical protein [Lentilactobacillus sunkii]OFA10778.1 hypothetical protein LASUN_13280 [Lentilactobacillus sunkii]
MTKYLKITAVEAEQFDGSSLMIVKYQIRATDLSDFFADPAWMYFLPTKEGETQIQKGDWIATGLDSEHWVITDSVFRKTYKKV